MYRHLFDEAIGTPPPDALDVDLLIKQQRQRRRLIQTSTIAGPAAAVLVAGSLIWAAPGLRSRPAVPAPSQASSPVDDDQNAARLQAAVRQALLAAAPGATVDPGSFEMLRSTGVSPLTYTGVGTISVNGRTGRVSVTIMRGQVIRQCAKPSDCQPVTGPHGETGNLISVSGLNGGIVGCDVALDRSMVDGTSVDIDVTGTRSHDGSVSDAPLSADQVIRMAEDRALRATS
jgi:hypothetical protein